MTHPTRFLQPILECPDDDQPRLQYADWLDSQDNPLGEFIRLQCMVEKDAVCKPHLDYERRAQVLLARFKSLWSENFADCVEWCSFRRGFIEEIALTTRQLYRHAAELFRHAPVLDIHLQFDGRNLAALPEVPVQYTLFLDLSSQRLGDDRIEDLAEAPLLEYAHGLNLGHTALGDEGLDCLIDSPRLGKLRELYINDNPITDDGVRQFVMAPIAEQLDFLDVRFTDISDEGTDILARAMGDKVLHGRECH